MTQRFVPLLRGTGNTSLIKTVTSENKLVRNSGAVFDTITMPSNIRRLGDNALLYLVAINNLNFDINQDLVPTDVNFSDDHDLELPGKPRKLSFPVHERSHGFIIRT